jgi:hypothetical protein
MTPTPPPAAPTNLDELKAALAQDTKVQVSRTPGIGLLTYSG